MGKVKVPPVRNPPDTAPMYGPFLPQYGPELPPAPTTSVSGGNSYVNGGVSTFSSDENVCYPEDEFGVAGPAPVKPPTSATSAPIPDFMLEHNMLRPEPSLLSINTDNRPVPLLDPGPANAPRPEPTLANQSQGPYERPKSDPWLEGDAPLYFGDGYSDGDHSRVGGGLIGYDGNDAAHKEFWFDGAGGMFDTQDVNRQYTDTRVGGQADLNSFYWRFGRGSGSNLEVYGPRASANASAGTDGFSLGAGGYGAGFDGTLGDIDPDETDTRVHGGASLGLSAGLRGHWGDKDHDGLREYGFGLDLGPFSFDFQTEKFSEWWGNRAVDYAGLQQVTEGMNADMDARMLEDERARLYGSHQQTAHEEMPPMPTQ